jgi:mRNA-degrading endonuclease RelE of RelBE toxin-antitoxin system
MARVTITRQAARQFDELPTPIRERVEKIMERLERWPDVSGVRPLRGPLAGHYRARTGVRSGKSGGPIPESLAG